MKTVFIMILILIPFFSSAAQAATCEATNGWTVGTRPLMVGKTRVPGNVMVWVHDENQEVVVVFSADSENGGEAPSPGESDPYQIAAGFTDNIGLNSFTWSTPFGCPRCAPDVLQLPSTIQIESDSGHFKLICKK